MKTTHAAAPLTETQIEDYWKNGYLVVPDLVPPASIDRVLEEAHRVPVAPGGGWTPKTFDHDQPLLDAALHRLLVEPSIVSAVEQIFEAPARVYYGMLAIVPAQGGKGLEWHQDNMYNLVLGRALNTFVALCDITPDKAILWVAPGSHRLGVQESLTREGHRVAKTPENGRPLPTLPKGSVCIFDRSTLHHSKRNETAEHRYAYAAQYQEENARNGESGRKDPRRLRVAELRRMWEEAI
ncbi:MAG: phytanoyl-CoA dioxygenase family protein [Spirochaetes bacterium]|nr:phytanoyl-CoA dioxygenase family protein [Spirochaetota bacterium]